MRASFLFDFGLAAVVPAADGALVTLQCRCLAELDGAGRIRTVVCCMRKLEEHGAAWREGKAAAGSSR